MVGSIVTLGLLAAPASADDLVPDGCVGAEAYVCTGSATPFDDRPDVTIYHETIGLAVQATPLVPGVTVGGQEIGGVVIVVGGQSVNGTTIEVGPTGPVATGVTTPVGVCAFVVCYPAGTPIDVPGLPLPIVPVVVPGVTVPTETLNVPVVGAVPTETTPSLGVPATDVELVQLAVYSTQRWETKDAAEAICEAGGGYMYGQWYGIENGYRYDCREGSTAPVANLILDLSGIG